MEGSPGSKCTSTMARTELPGPRSRRRTLQKSFLTSEFRKRSSSCGRAAGEGSGGCRPAGPLWVPPGRRPGGVEPHPRPHAHTHRTLDAPGRLPKQLRLGVGHLGRVEQLLPLDPLELQHALERLGGYGGGGSEALPGTHRASGLATGTGPSNKPHGCRRVAVSQMVMRLVGSQGQGWHQLPGGLLGAVPQAGLQRERQVSSRVPGTHTCACITLNPQTTHTCVLNATLPPSAPTCRAGLLPGRGRSFPGLSGPLLTCPQPAAPHSPGQLEPSASSKGVFPSEQQPKGEL